MKFSPLACIFAAFATTPAMAQLFACTPKEYAQYKDETKSNSARMSLAFEHCRNVRTIEANNKLLMLAIKHNMRRDADEAQKNIAQCEAEQTKIVSALSAANDDKNLKFMRAGCKD